MEAKEPSFAPIFRCPICHKDYGTEAQARECYAKTKKPRFKPGDILVVTQGYHWNDGAAHWVVGGEGREVPIKGAEPLKFYYVVTSVDHGDKNQCGHSLHTNVYSLQTLALHNGHKDGMSGWTPLVGHLRLELAENPPAQVVEEAKALVGRKFYNLL